MKFIYEITGKNGSITIDIMKANLEEIIFFYDSLSDEFELDLQMVKG